ncbi:MAG: protein-tyrosine-phosphatase [Spirochaetota bacterium]
MTNPETQAALSSERQETLQEIASFVETKRQQGKIAKLSFVSTHNARRSIIAEIIGQTLSEHFRIAYVECYSGGTEVSKVDANAITTLQKFGFHFSHTSDNSMNPKHQIQTSKNFSKQLFSKLYTDPPNPRSEYAAILLCNQADKNCPVVYGAEVRYRLPFADLQAFDSLRDVADKYEKAILAIARELYFLFYTIDT